jgi:hypothetical protein
MEQRQLKIVTFRNLDSRENEDVVRILLKFMQDSNLESVQKGLEEIIRAYAINKNRLNRKIMELEDDLSNKELLLNQCYEKIDNYETVLNLYRMFQRQLNNLEL